jgi:hypothetical protein
MFFVEQAAAVGAADRVRFRRFIETAIVSARSVTFHLQKQYDQIAGFRGWYETWQNRLRADPLARFFTEKRNHALKEGPLEVRKHIDVHVSATVRATMTVSATVTRGQPWYRRSPKILIEDALSPLRSCLHGPLTERRRRRFARESQPAERVTVSESLHFTEAPWSERPALDLIREYLDTLRTLVEEAEATFGPHDPETG